MDCEETSKRAGFVEDEKIIAIGAFDFFNGERKRIGGMKIVDGFVHVFFGAIGFFDFESVESFGMNNANDFITIVNDGEIGEAGFVEFIKCKWTEDFFTVYKNKFFFGSH